RNKTMQKISPKNIAQAIYDASKGKSGSDLGLIAKRGAKVLQDKRMLNKSEEVLKALSNIFEKEGGIIRAKVTTAKKLTGEDRHRLEKEIKEKYKARVVES